MLLNFLASSSPDSRGKRNCICVTIVSLRQTQGAWCRAHVSLASVEVRFKDLSVSTEVAVGARGEPTVLNAFRNKFEV